MLGDQLEGIDRDLGTLERAAGVQDGAALAQHLESAIALVDRVMRAWLDHAGRAQPPEHADVLEVWKALAKGDPTWNAIRDNCRELVYYRNCLALDRTDALPPQPHRMAVRTARHVYLYIRSRAVREGLVGP
jgi:hypothetical protein